MNTINVNRKNSLNKHAEKWKMIRMMIIVMRVIKDSLIHGRNNRHRKALVVVVIVGQIILQELKKR